MDSRKAASIGLVALVFVVGGTATVLESFGTIRGTADVKPALEFAEVQATNNSGEYILLMNQANEKVNVSDIRISDAESSDNLVSTNSTDYASSGEYILVVVENSVIVSYNGPSDFIKASTQDAGITGGLTDDGENLDLELSKVLINEFDYEKGCSEAEAEKPEEGCSEPKFVVESP
jgi:hypothetical protein